MVVVIVIMGRIQSWPSLDLCWSDASFGPAGGRGHQGLIAMYGGCPIQWESKQQAFGTLSTSESELLGYTDAMAMGESVSAVIDILEGSQLSVREGRQGALWGQPIRSSTSWEPWWTMEYPSLAFTQLCPSREDEVGALEGTFLALNWLLTCWPRRLLQWLRGRSSTASWGWPDGQFRVWM